MHHEIDGPAADYPATLRTTGEEHPLRSYRRRCQLSQESVAAAIAVSKSTISRIENWLLTPTLGVVERLVEFSGGVLSAGSFLPGRTPRK